MTERPAVRRWDKPLRRELKRLWQLFNVTEGIAGNNDTLAIQQLVWAMRRIERPEWLPERQRAAAVVKSVTELISTQEAVLLDDLRLVLNMPDLRVSDAVGIMRENYATGFEYDQTQVLEGTLSCEPLRAVARDRLARSQDHLSSRSKKSPSAPLA